MVNTLFSICSLSGPSIFCFVDYASKISLLMALPTSQQPFRELQKNSDDPILAVEGKAKFVPLVIIFSAKFKLKMLDQKIGN